MRVLHIINSLAAGGAEKLAEQMLPIMAREYGITCNVLLLTDKGNVFDDELRKNGVQIDVVPYRRPRSPLNPLLIRRYINKGNYDVVHAHLFPTFYWVSLAARLTLRPKPSFFVTEHCTHNERRDRKWLKPVERLIYSQYDRVFSVSCAALSNLIGWLSLSETEKFVVIQNGIDLKPFYDAVPYEKSEICGTREDQIVLVTMVARFTPEKDQKTLIRCLSVLPEKVHVAFVGSGPLKGECEELAAELGVRSRVHFLGFRRDVPRILKTSDIVVLSSHREAFGLTAVEGMAAGKPVVGTNVQGLSDVIGDTALLFACGDYEGLGTIISRLLDDPAYYRSVAERFLQRSKEFDIRKTIEGLLDFYQQALGRTSS